MGELRPGLGTLVDREGSGGHPVAVMPDVVVGRETSGAVGRGAGADVRERLTDSATRLAAEGGYLSIDGEQIAQYAGVSVEEFHREFIDENQCLMVAYDRFLERMLDHI